MFHGAELTVNEGLVQLPVAPPEPAGYRGTKTMATWPAAGDEAGDEAGEEAEAGAVVVVTPAAAGEPDADVVEVECPPAACCWEVAVVVDELDDPPAASGGSL